MERWACVDVPLLALQLLLESHPDWREHPVAVVDREVAQGTILQVNRHARRYEIRPGMRYAAGLSLNGALRASVVDEEQVAAITDELLDVLHDFSPDVESGAPAASRQSLFWLRASGLDRLFGSFDVWASQLHEAVRDAVGFRTSVTVGFSRFGTYATSRSERAGWRVFESEEEERECCGRVPLELLDLDEKVLEKLEKLAVRTVEEFLALPSSGIRKRFGEEAARLWRFASGGATVPLQPIAWEEPVARGVHLDDSMHDSTRLVFLLKSELHPILMQLAARYCDLRELIVNLHLEDGDDRDLVVRPATPTLEEGPLLELLRLRLDRLSLPAPIVRIELTAEPIPYHSEQGHMFRDNARRDLRVANHALARLQAEYGEDAVCQIVPRDRHLPEARFTLEPLQALRRPQPEPPERPTLIRRIFARPHPLPRFAPEIGPGSGWLIRDLDEGVVSDAHGPHRITGGWWVSNGVGRDYWFARTTRGDIFWVYWDHRRRQWFLHGVVE
jgi:protein ImuB